MISQLLRGGPPTFAPTGSVTSVDASAFLTPAEKAALAAKGSAPAATQSSPAAGGVPGQGGGAPMAGGAPAGGVDSANIQSIMQGLGMSGGGQAGGGLMASIAKMLPMFMGG